jgi:hypothetical protein
MHQSHDPDLIAAYADGSQDPVAERVLATCAECRAELALHHQVRDILAGAPASAMTDDERSAMRAGVHAGMLDPIHGGVGGSRESAEVISLESRRQRRWLSLGSVAAAVFVTVGVVGLLNQGGDDASGDFLLAGSESTTASDDVASGLALEDATATTAAAATSEEAFTPMSDADRATSAETTAAGDGADTGIGLIADAGAITGVQFDTLVAATIEWVADQPAAEPLDVAWFNDREIPAPSCLSSEVGTVFAVINATVDGQDVQAFVVSDPTTSEYISDVFLVDGCESFES